MPNIFITDSFVYSAKCPPEKDQEIFWDHPKGPDGRVRNGAVPGLGLRVTANGIKSFVHAYTFRGRRKRKVLGSINIMDIASARLAVNQRLQQLAAGENPDIDGADQDRADLLTVRDIIDLYWEKRMSGLSESHQYQFALHVAAWHKRPPRLQTRRGRNISKSYVDFGTMFADRDFASIKPLDIERFTSQFQSPHSHNSALKLTAALYNWAIRMQVVDMRNPCDPIRERKVVRQRRNYSTEQIERIAHHIFNPVLECLPEIAGPDGTARRDAGLRKAHVAVATDQMTELCNFMGILLLTMARPNELQKAEFAHFDLEQLIWHKHNTKGIKLSRATYEYAYRSVPIHPRVASMIRSQRARWPASALVFPSHADLSKPRDNFRKGLARFKSLPGVPAHFQLYDLKRIAISLMLTGYGVSREAVSHYVDHKGNLETTMIYDLGLVDPLRPVTEKLGDILGV